MRLLLIPGAFVALALSAAGAVAQTPSISSGPTLGGAPPPSIPEAGTVVLGAVFAGDMKPIRSGLVWRVFEDKGDVDQTSALAKSTDATPTFSLPPGAYIVHATYGFAGVTKRVTVQGGALTERLTISAGALRLSGAIADVPIPPNRVAFSVFVPVGNNVEGRLIRSEVKAGEIIRLPDGMYHVVSTYGESNAIARADLKVDSGRVTEATLNHRAATVTLKLVAAAGGEAFAGTAFSVLTPGGDVIREAIGAFPSVTLAEGEYMLIARQGEQVFNREFRVNSGFDRDVEVLTTAHAKVEGQKP